MVWYFTWPCNILYFFNELDQLLTIIYLYLFQNPWIPMGTGSIKPQPSVEKKIGRKEKEEEEEEGGGGGGNGEKMKRERGKKRGEEVEGKKKKEEEETKAWPGEGQLREGARETMKEVRENKMMQIIDCSQLMMVDSILMK